MLCSNKANYTKKTTNTGKGIFWSSGGNASGKDFAPVSPPLSRNRLHQRTGATWQTNEIFVCPVQTGSTQYLGKGCRTGWIGWAEFQSTKKNSLWGHGMNRLVMEKKKSCFCQVYSHWKNSTRLLWQVLPAQGAFSLRSTLLISEMRLGKTSSYLGQPKKKHPMPEGFPAWKLASA